MTLGDRTKLSIGIGTGLILSYLVVSYMIGEPNPSEWLETARTKMEQPEPVREDFERPDTLYNFNDRQA
jgi:hypothetical protein